MNSVTISQMLDFSEKIARKYNLLDRKENKMKMFNWFKKKENENENSGKYTLKNVGDVQYFKRENKKVQVKRTSAWAIYQGLKVSFRSGSFVCTYADETFVEPVLRVEVVGKVQPRKEYKYKPTGRPVGRPRKDGKNVERKTGTKREKICEMLKDGVKTKIIAMALGVSVGYVNNIKREIKNVK